MRMLMEQAPGFVAALRGPDHVFEFANASYAGLVGHRDILGKPVAEALPEVVEQGFIALLDSVYESGEPFVGKAVPVKLQREAGGALEEVFVDFIYQPLVEPDHSVSGIFVQGHEVTEQVRSVQALRESEELVRTIAENSTQGFAMMDARGYCTYANRAWLEMTGFTAEEIGARPLHYLVHHHYPDGRPYPMEECPLDRALPENFDVRAHEDLFFRKDGSTFPVLCAASPIFKDGRPISTVIEIRDVTEARRTESELRQSEGRYRLITDAAFDAVWDVDLDADWIEWNPAISERFGWTDAVRGTPAIWWEQRVHPDDRKRVTTSFQEAIDGTVTHWEESYRFQRADGTYADVLDRGRALRDPKGKALRIIGAMVDLTDLLTAERALGESESRFRALVEASAQIVWTTDAGGAVIDDSRSWRAFTGQSLDEWLGYGWTNVLHPDDRARAEAAWRDAVSRRSSYDVEYRIRRHDGEYRWTLARGVPVFDEDGSIREWVGMNTDITEQKAAEEALRASEELFRLALDAADIAVFEWDFDSDAVVGDARLYQLLALPVGAPVKASETVAVRVHPDDASRVSAAITQGLIDGRYGVAFRLLPPPNTEYPDGRAYRWTTAQGLVRYEGEERRPYRIVGTFRDITVEREAAERLREINTELEERVTIRTTELQEANRALEIRNRELQDFAYVASHDLQEPLRKIRTFAGMLSTEEAGQLTAEGTHYVERMQGAAERMSSLIRDLLAFSRVETKGAQTQNVDLNEVLKGVMADLDVRLQETGGRLDVRGQLPTLQADLVQMHQLLLNLIGNALKFHRPGVPPVVRVSGDREAGSVGIVVEDNGIGFEEKYAERIFSPFQRLHAKHEFDGTGMGLAIVRRIVERHGGTVTATGAPGKGSRFVVKLPPPSEVLNPGT